tara:strand:+ start:2409 stop:4385 length:1977 start_codon:yes stop_codon:yes gene_type:complete
MALITLDFETPYEGKKPPKVERSKFSLRTRTYEEYILDSELFCVMGVSYQINDAPRVWIQHDGVSDKPIRDALTALFPPGNTHILLAHNCMFDASILCWYFGLRAGQYWCTQAMSNLLWSQGKASLEALSLRLFPSSPDKRKGTELADFAGLWPTDMTADMWTTYQKYCDNDVFITYESFKVMHQFFPREELEVIDMTIKMFCQPKFVLDRERIKKYKKTLQTERNKKILESGLSETVLASQNKFVEIVRSHGVEVPIIPSPTAKNPKNTKPALGKADIEFIEMRARHPEIEHLWAGRIAAKSNNNLKRCDRFLSHSNREKHFIAVFLKYAGALTKRWSGGNSSNFQNLGRGSDLRYALKAPPKHKVVVRDLANIEGRVNAWFNGQFDKCEQFANGVDLYNELASDIFGYPVDRKAKVQDADGNYTKDGVMVADEDDADYLQWEEGFVGKIGELGLGYGMGAAKFGVTVAVMGNVLLTEDIKQTAVKTWRKNNHMIEKGWRLGDRAIFDMASPNMTPYNWGCIRVERNRLALPNGTYLTYPNLQMVEDFEANTRGFEYWNGKHMAGIWGGTLIENIIQALARIIMTSQMLEMNRIVEPMSEHSGLALTVHDEAVFVVPDDQADYVYEELGVIMAKPPTWADDRLPLASEGGIADNYSK